MVETTRGGGGKTSGLYILSFAFLLSACAGGEEIVTTSFLPPPAYETDATERPDQVPIAAVTYLGSPLATRAASQQSLNQSGGGKACGFRDRFDRGTTLAYNFDDDHQLGFKVGVRGGKSDIGISQAKLVFRYKFNSVASPRQRPVQNNCQYASHWQGLVGSAFNELFLRENDTIWSEFRDRGLDFWRRR